MTITRSEDRLHEEGARYRLAATDVVRLGRRREFHRTLLATALLFVVQQPMVAATTGRWQTSYDLRPEVPGRLSLLVDLFLVAAYLLVAYRSWGLVRAHRAPRPVRWVCLSGLALVMAGAALDLVENARLWDRFGATTADTASYDVAFAGPLDGPSLSQAKLALVAVGLLLTVLSTLRDSTRNPALAARMPMSGSNEDVVICCSGGGIRSAAFSLGGLQELTSREVYDDAAAVVGVSGGGYTAAALHVLRWGPEDHSPTSRDSAQEWMPLPAERPAFALDSPETQWLRRHTRYVLDSMRVAAQAALSLVFGIAVNLLLLTIALGGTAWVLAWLFLASGRLDAWPRADRLRGDELAATLQAGIGGAYTGDWAPVGWVWLIPSLGVVLFLVEMGWDRFQTPPRIARTALRRWSVWLLTGGAAACALVLGVPWVLTEVAEHAVSSGDATARLAHQVGLVPTRVCNAVLATGSSACGVDGSTAAATSTTTVGTVSVAGVIGAILAVLASARGTAGVQDSGKNGAGALLARLWAKIKDPVVPWAAVAVIVVIAVVVQLRWVSTLVQNPSLLDDWHLALIAGVLLVAVKLITEPNRTSMHHFFRERISTAFFVRRDGDTVADVPYRRPLRFSQAEPPPRRGPRLVTCAVANVSDQILVPSRRGCTPFVFDHDRMGLTDRMLPEGAALRPSRLYEFAADHNYRDATVPAAIAISAAAFSPLAGRENVRLGPYRAVLALGNARLGVWLPNPIWVDAAGLVRRLLRLGRLDEAAEAYAELPRADRDYLALPEPTIGLLSRGSHQINIRQALHRLAVAEVTGDRSGATDAIQHAADVVAAATGTTPPPMQTLEQAGRELRTIGDSLGHRPRGLWFWQTAELVRNVFKKPGLTRLVGEAVGRTSVYDRFLYVTDGGHYDNLGLIEALRRRPREIFVLDASNDPEDSFRTLGKAIATARIDLDCEVDLDPAGMRRLAESRAPAAWCTGRYQFADGDHGNIYLVKAIMLDGQAWDVETYAAENPEFPRTGTGNQLYSEFDFEAYRALGQYAAAQLIASADYRLARRRLGISG